MTIALGMLSAGGLIVAADSQETAGPFKRDQLKTEHVTVRRPGFSGACAIAGAGYAAFIDSCSLELRRVFISRDTTPDNWEDRVGSVLSDFYRAHVIPFGYREDMDFALIVAAQINGRACLLSTNKTVVQEPPMFTAVGYGEAMARTLYDQHVRHNIADTPSAVLMAGYLVFRVKQTVDTCGHFTQVVILQNDQSIEIDYERTALWDPIYRAYEKSVAPLFWAAVSGDTEKGIATAASGLVEIGKKFRRISQRTMRGVTRFDPSWLGGGFTKRRPTARKRKRSS